MTPNVSTTTTSKKSRRSSLQTPPWPSNNKSFKTNIDDLPNVTLIEILSRLPHSKMLFQCKCVCKSWSSIIADDEFRCRFLCLHGRIRNGTLIFRNPRKKKEFFILPELELPMFKSHNFCLKNFLPYFEEEPVVLGVCNDLVLCCATMSYQRDYYICNPYTKQYVQVPPSPSCHKEVRVGFICDPYYKEQENSHVVDVDFRFAIVRILSDDPDYMASTYQIEIFSSETGGRWTQSVLKSPRMFCLHDIALSGGIACNGMLYWWSGAAIYDGLIIGLDPYNPASFHSIYAPDEPIDRYQISRNVSIIYIVEFSHFSVCPRSGRLRLCYLIPDHINPPSISVWELKDDGEQWCNLTAGKICLSPVIHERMRMIPYHQWGREMDNTFDVLALDPSNEDIMYLQVFDRIVTFNIRERKLEETTTLPFPYKYMSNNVVRFGKTVFPFVLPSWPTPLPNLQIG